MNFYRKKGNLTSGLDRGINIASKLKIFVGDNELKKIKAGHRITLTSNEIKHIIIIVTLENKGYFLKRTIEKVSNQETGSLSNLLSRLMKLGIPLMENVITALAKGVLIPFGLTATASATDTGTQKKIYGSDLTTL